MAKITLAKQSDVSVASQIDISSRIVTHALERLRQLEETNGLSPTEIGSIKDLVACSTAIRKELDAQKTGDTVSQLTPEERVTLLQKLLAEAQEEKGEEEPCPQS